MLGYAIIDTETTGLNIRGNDRVIEIAVVLLDTDFNFIGTYETVLNPERDLGLVSLHGIDGLIASQGVSFHDIMPSLSTLLHDRVIIGHNVDYDIRMLQTEYEKEGITIDAGIPIDTIKIAKGIPQHFSSHKLGDLCEYFDIPLVNAHSAIADALATAGLFITLLEQYDPDINAYPSNLSNVTRSEDFSGWKPRREIIKKSSNVISLRSYIKQLPNTDASNGDMSTKVIDGYLKTIHLSLLNNSFSSVEKQTMEALITSLNLSKQNAIDLNEEYIFMLICQNLQQNKMKWKNSPVTDRIDVAKEFTGIKDATVNTMVMQTMDQAQLIEPTVEKLKSYFSFVKGDAFTITGEVFDHSRKYWQDELQQRGYVLKQTTTKATKLIIAHDPYSLSAKAVTARRYGIPILTESTVDRILKKEM